jgi:hypothetical protein
MLRELCSSTALVRVAGELVAKAYKVKPTGYKAPNAYGNYASLIHMYIAQFTMIVVQKSPDMRGSRFA